MNSSKDKEQKDEIKSLKKELKLTKGVLDGQNKKLD